MGARCPSQRRAVASLDRALLRARQLETELVSFVEAKARLLSENNELSEAVAQLEHERKELQTNSKHIKTTLMPKLAQFEQDNQKLTSDFRSLQLSVDLLSSMYATHCDAIQHMQSQLAAVTQVSAHTLCFGVCLV